MKQALTVLAAALLASCASQQKTTSPGTAATAVDQRAAERTAVVDPSTLNGEQVRVLQRALVDRGFAIDLTGNFDQPTQSALTDFQRARGLPATGNLNGPTMDALGLDPRDVRPVAGTAGTDTQPSAPSGSSTTGSTGGSDTRGSNPDTMPDSGTTPTTPQSSY